MDSPMRAHLSHTLTNLPLNIHNISFRSKSNSEQICVSIKFVKTFKLN